MTRLGCEGLSVRLGRRVALADVDLDLQPGRLIVAVGPNGAGKTTLLRVLAGLVPPARGRVILNGMPVDRLRAAERAKAIAYLPQAGIVGWPLPVKSIVALGRLPHGERPDALTAAGDHAVAAAIAAVGLKGFESRPVTELSGGERARVLLARALATEAPVLLVDEPVAALDPRHQLIVLDVLRSQARAGAIVLAVMHDLSLAARFADEVVLLADGIVQSRGIPADVLTEERLASFFGIAARVEIAEGQLNIAAERAIPIDERQPDAFLSRHCAPGASRKR